MMSGSKAPDSDAYGLFRATHSHNPTLYSHIAGFHPTFMLISGRVPSSKSTYEQAHVDLELLTLVSYFFLLCPKEIHPTRTSIATPMIIHGTR